ncbi:hypothetical protein CPB86DRAFT_791319 [Serendipita vermifera]|nr:hypothetical protein CPB86DRAFT_791319 [Serendipita vermifera]
MSTEWENHQREESDLATLETEYIIHDEALDHVDISLREVQKQGQRRRDDHPLEHAPAESNPLTTTTFTLISPLLPEPVRYGPPASTSTETTEEGYNLPEEIEDVGARKVRFSLPEQDDHATSSIPTTSAPVVRRTGRVFSPSTDVDIFKRSSEEVLARFLGQRPSGWDWTRENAGPPSPPAIPQRWTPSGI